MHYTISNVTSDKGKTIPETKLIYIDTVAYNVDDTKDEKPSSEDGPDWEDYWKKWTGRNLTDEKCACCGCALTKENRVGAHIRLIGELDNTKDAWIALFCKSCNNPSDKKARQVKSLSWIVRTVMSAAHKNVS